MRVTAEGTHQPVRCGGIVSDGKGLAADALGVQGRPQADSPASIS